ncbi:hypothetical protein MTR67_035101, partial [Solanum verrucosum]
GGVTVQKGSESSLVVGVKEKQDSDPILLQLKGAVHQQRVEIFSLGGRGVIRYQGQFCVPKNCMKRKIADFVAKRPNFQQVKVEHQKPGGMNQEINIPTWKWEVINMDFITGLPRTRKQHDSIWVIVKSFQKGLGTQVNLNIAFHPQTDGQAERTIQTLEGMLRACVINFKGSWDDHLPLIEFAYNNSYHSNIHVTTQA